MNTGEPWKNAFVSKERLHCALQKEEEERQRLEKEEQERQKAEQGDAGDGEGGADKPQGDDDDAQVGKVQKMDADSTTDEKGEARKEQKAESNEADDDVIMIPDDDDEGIWDSLVLGIHVCNSDQSCMTPRPNRMRHV